MKDKVIRSSAESCHMGQFSHIKALTMWTLERETSGWGGVRGRRLLNRVQGICDERNLFIEAWGSHSG